MYPDIFEPSTFSFRIKKFPCPHVSLFKSNLLIHTYPTRIRTHSSTQDSSGNIGNRACVEVAILNTVFTVNSWAQSVKSPDKTSYPEIASTRFRIHSVFKNFHSGEPKRIQKVADSYAEFTGYVWTWKFLI